MALNLLHDRYAGIQVDHQHTRYPNPWVMNSLLSLPVNVTPTG